MASSDLLTIDGLRLTRGKREILRGISMHVRRGEILALMGLSGGGKTTVLRCIAGLEPYEGSISINRKDVGMVFQSHYLFEHLTVLGNVKLAPVHVRRVPRNEAGEQAIALLKLLGVDHRRNALPRELSGGEAQRVAKSRAKSSSCVVTMSVRPPRVRSTSVSPSS